MASEKKEKKVTSSKKTAAKKAVKKTEKVTASKAKAQPVRKKAVAKSKSKSESVDSAAPEKEKTASQAKSKAAVGKKKTAAKVKTTPKVKTAAQAKKVTKAAPAKKESAAPKAPEKKKADVPVKKKASAKSSPAKVKDKPVETASAEVKTEATTVEVQGDDKVRHTTVNINFLVSVARAIKESVEPLIHSLKGREIISEATSGDVTFQIDKTAEKALEVYLRSVNLPLSYYSEDEGYSTFTSKQPKHLLIVDPIDGTRAAKNGFEGCVVAVASTRVLERPTIADIDYACVMELTNDRYFVAERGKGARYYLNGSLKRPKLSTNTDLESLVWSMTIPARPAELVFPTAARLIDLSSLKGGFFICNSTSFSLTRLLTNQMEACVDFANRYHRDMPDELKHLFTFAGRGKVIGIAPYDMAASLLIAQEAGCIVTDAYGHSFDDLLLLDSTETNQRSIIAASNKVLHDKLLTFFDTRIKQFQEKLQDLKPAT